MTMGGGTARGSVNAVMVLLALLLIASIAAGLYYYNKAMAVASERGMALAEETVDFFDDYIVAVNNYHTAQGYYDLATANLQFGDYYVLGRDYYYQGAAAFYDQAKTQIKDGDQFLAQAKSRLQRTEGREANEFYSADVKNRLTQIEVMMDASEKLYKLVDYKSVELYEVNYGSDERANEYFNKSNELVGELNAAFEELSVVSNEIDVAWGENWYPSYKGSSL